MRCMEKTGDLAQCIAGADKVISMPQASPAILREAQYLKAKSLFGQNKKSDAIPILKQLAESTKTAEGAEAKYLVAQYSTIATTTILLKMKFSIISRKVRLTNIGSPAASSSCPTSITPRAMISKRFSISKPSKRVILTATTSKA